MTQERHLITLTNPEVKKVNEAIGKEIDGKKSVQYNDQSAGYLFTLEEMEEIFPKLPQERFAVEFSIAIRKAKDPFWDAEFDDWTYEQMNDQIYDWLGEQGIFTYYQDDESREDNLSNIEAIKEMMQKIEDYKESNNGHLGLFLEMVHSELDQGIYNIEEEMDDMDHDAVFHLYYFADNLNGSGNVQEDLRNRLTELDAEVMQRKVKFNEGVLLKRPGCDNYKKVGTHTLIERNGRPEDVFNTHIKDRIEEDQWTIETDSEAIEYKREMYIYDSYPAKRFTELTKLLVFASEQNITTYDNLVSEAKKQKNWKVK